MSNKKLYKDTFDQIQMSEEVFGKVRNMSNNERKSKRSFKVRYAMVFAALAVVFVMSNVITYAASGTTLIEKVALYVDGKKINISEMYDVKKKDDGKGNVSYEYTLKDDEANVSIDEKVLDENDLSIDSDYDSHNDAFEITISSGKVEKIDDKIYLIVGDNLKKLDITEDFKDGNANGEFELNGESYQYTVTGSEQENSVTIHKK